MDYEAEDKGALKAAKLALLAEDGVTVERTSQSNQVIVTCEDERFVYVWNGYDWLPRYQMHGGVR